MEEDVRQHLRRADEQSAAAVGENSHSCCSHLAQPLLSDQSAIRDQSLRLQVIKALETTLNQLLLLFSHDSAFTDSYLSGNQSASRLN